MVLSFCKIGSIPSFPKLLKISFLVSIPLLHCSCTVLAQPEAILISITHLRALLLLLTAHLKMFTCENTGFKGLLGPQSPISKLWATTWHLWSNENKCVRNPPPPNAHKPCISERTDLDGRQVLCVHWFTQRCLPGTHQCQALTNGFVWLTLLGRKWQKWVNNENFSKCTPGAGLVNILLWESSLSRVRSDHYPDCVFALPGHNVVSFLHSKKKKVSGYFEFANAALSFICTEAI